MEQFDADELLAWIWGGGRATFLEYMQIVPCRPSSKNLRRLQASRLPGMDVSIHAAALDKAKATLLLLMYTSCS